MTIIRHELRQGKTSLWIWTASIGFLLAICIFLFPEMKGQMDSVNDMFASMGSFWRKPMRLRRRCMRILNRGSQR